MTPDFIFPAMWGLLLLASFVGYGCFLRRALFPNEQFGWANEAAWGMAFVIMLGGILAYAHVISGNLLISLTVVGVVLMGADKVPFASHRIGSLIEQSKALSIVDIIKLVLYVSIFSLVVIQYLHSVNLASPAITDDMKAYFAFPKQLLELGSFNADPFDRMRLGNGLGGQSMLHALILSNFDFSNLMLVDGGVALLICVGLVLRVCSQRRLSAIWIFVILLFFLSLPLIKMRVNNSSLVTGMVMFLALFLFLDRKDLNDGAPIRNAFIVGLLSAGACVLKTNLIPPLVFTLAFSYLCHIYATRFGRPALLEAILVPTFVLLMLLPWMMTLKQTSGTMLWPIFGSGYEDSNYGSYFREMISGGLTFKAKWEIIFYRFILNSTNLLFLMTSLIVYSIVKLRRRAVTHAYIFGALMGSSLILVNFDITNTDPFFRYTFVPVSIALLLVFIELASRTIVELKERENLVHAPTTKFWMPANGWINTLRHFIAGVGLIFFVLWVFNYSSRNWQNYQKLAEDLRTQVEKNEIVPEVEYLRHRKAQATIPSGEAIFSHDLYTFLYNYKQNKIFNITIPGGASPPPGMPYFQGPEKVADYLLSHGIRYVTYHYKDQAGHPTLDYLFRLAPTRPYSHRVLARSKVALDRALDELGYLRDRIYDDGTLFVIDLKVGSKTHEKYVEPNYFQLGKILAPAWAKTNGFDSRKVWTYGQGEISGIEYELAQGDNILALNTFGYIPWGDDLRRLNIMLTVNGKPLSMIARSRNSYYFSLEPINEPITNIVISSSTFNPRNESQFHLKDHYLDESSLGIDVDTIQILNTGALQSIGRHRP